MSTHPILGSVRPRLLGKQDLVSALDCQSFYLLALYASVPKVLNNLFLAWELLGPFLWSYSQRKFILWSSLFIAKPPVFHSDNHSMQARDLGKGVKADRLEFLWWGQLVKSVKKHWRVLSQLNYPSLKAFFSAKGTAIKKCSFRPNFIHIQLVQEAGPLSYLPAWKSRANSDRKEHSDATSPD